MKTTLHDRANQRKLIRPRGRLSDLKKVMADRQWDVLPQGIRGQRILRWSADHAYLADPANPERSVRRWCRKVAPWLKPAELDAIVAYTKTSNKRWSDDESALTLEVSLADRDRLHLRFIGANDDLNFARRRDAQHEKDAGYARTYRAKHSSGRPRGRPRLELSPEEIAVRKAQDADRKRAERAAKCSGRPRGRPKNASRENASDSYSNNRRPDAINPDAISLEPVSPASMQGPPQAAPSPPKSLIVVPPDAVILEGEIITGGRSRDSRPKMPKMNRHVLSAIARAYEIQREQGRR
jgi:hypothetical protein